MHIVIPRETTTHEHRVALVPQHVSELDRLGAKILIEKGAGIAAGFPDNFYENAEVCADPAQLYAEADIILKVQMPTLAEIALFPPQAVVIGLLSPSRNLPNVQALSAKGITSFAMELIPRISRAQGMDALSSQASIAGYKASLIAANTSNRFFPMLTTAAGTIRPSSVLVIGTGVAGLQAIATAKRLGAVVYAYDVRSATKEQVESLGAKMIEIDVQAESAGGYARELTADEKHKQQQALAEAVSKAQVVITTALIPGRPAPVIITKSMVEKMQPGSVIVDIAAESGGNCELTQADKTIDHHGVRICGPINLPSMLAKDASQMYSKNLVNFLGLLIKEGQIAFNWDDPILAQSLLTYEGEIKSPVITGVS